MRYTQNTVLNTGILCDGLRAIDIDIDSRWIAATIAKLAIDTFGEAPVRSRSNSARRLFLYRAASGEPTKKTVAGPYGKVEVLGRGQQFVAFGMHESGVAYEWTLPDFTDFPLKALPVVTEEQVDEFLRQVAVIVGAHLPKPPLAKPEVTDRERAYAAKALSEKVVELAAKGEGSGRNDALNAVSYRMGKMINAGWIDRASVEAALTEACHQNGHEAKRGTKVVLATMASGLSKGMLKLPKPLEDIPVTEEILAFVQQGQPRFGVQAQADVSTITNAYRSTLQGDTAIVHRVSDVQSVPIEWLWKTRIAYGKVVMIAGDPGLGKSQLAAFFQYVEMIRPPLRHGDAFVPIGTTIVGATDFVVILMRQGAFDGIGEKLAAFIQQC
jgi:hypothetical protein